MAAPAFRIFKSNVLARAFVRSAVKTITASVTATKASNAGLTNLLSAAAGVTVTLPTASTKMIGARFRFLVNTLLTSGNYIVQVGNTTDAFIGGVILNDAGDSSAAAADYVLAVSGTSDTFTLPSANGGGRRGDYVEFECIASGIWAVSGAVSMLDPTTPFSSAVN